jgi:methylglutaconyl-CoA hydratase
MTELKTEQGYVDTRVSAQGVATVTFFHPNHNSLPSRLLTGLSDAFLSLGQRADVRVVVLQNVVGAAPKSGWWWQRIGPRRRDWRGG